MRKRARKTIRKPVRRVRTYTYKVTCPLPPTKAGEARHFTAFVYGAMNIDQAYDLFVVQHLDMAKRNGLRDKKRLPLKIERVKIKTLPKVSTEF